MSFRTRHVIQDKSTYWSTRVLGTTTHGTWLPDSHHTCHTRAIPVMTLMVRGVLQTNCSFGQVVLHQQCITRQLSSQHILRPRKANPPCQSTAHLYGLLSSICLQKPSSFLQQSARCDIRLDSLVMLRSVSDNPVGFGISARRLGQDRGSQPTYTLYASAPATKRL